MKKKILINIKGHEITLNSNIKMLLESYDENKYGPKYDRIFWSLSLTPFNSVRVIILGQDPYPTKSLATGLAFSVNRDEKLPQSLKNIFKELNRDLGINNKNGDLSTWSRQGVLLMNTIFTVEFGKANSHSKIGWQDISLSILEKLSDRGKCVFVLLGNSAQKFEKNIDMNKNKIIKTSHPSPLSVYRGFEGSGLFSKINECLYFGKKIDFKT